MTLHLREIDSEGFILDGHLSVSNTSELSAINISDNSFWMGDETLISLSGGKIKFKKRNKSVVPPAILQAGVEAGHESHQVTTDAALAHASVATVNDMKLSDWYKYLRTLKGDDTPGLNDVFSSYTDNDFEETLTLAGNAGNVPLKVHGDTLLCCGANDNVGLIANNPNRQWRVGIRGDTNDIFSIQDDTAGQMRLTIDSVGNVGIRTINPGAPLEVHGADLAGQAVGTTSLISRYVAGADGVLNIFGINQSNGEEGIGFQTQIDGRSWQSDLSAWSTGSAGRYNLCLQPYKGYVGIGSTNPSQQFEVNGNIVLSHGNDYAHNTDDRTLYIGGRNNSGSLVQAKCAIVATPSTSHGGAGVYGRSALHFCVGPDANDNTCASKAHSRLCITHAGNVGVGTTSPDCNLEIYGDTPTIKVTRSRNNTNYGTNVSFALLNSANEKFTYGRIGGSIADNTDGSEDGLLSFQVATNGNLRSNYEEEKMRILSNGNVGIGTTTPDYKLDVTGSIRCSGHVYANHLNMSHGRGDRNGDNTFYSSTDNYLRKNTASGMISSLGLDNRYIRKDADSTVNTNVNLTWSKSDEPSIKVQNQSYSAWLYVGGWSTSNNNDISRVRASNGNLHIDSAANGTLY